ncbi:MAG: beta-ketoacyl-ACP reductase [Alphaproteobacteria bacterium CG11_big_fil_rev_8_21_14_0_20_44_7]|nr:MAG: beta-ketoacyl-ACP reductase [Alphaproteobacteria bacterium CG11_big_fil_rev_8_21_14_0_20_44_7]
MFNLDNKTALITGASGGIGREIAKTLVAQGAKIAISGTNEERLQQTASEIGGDVVILTADLSNRESVENMAKQAEEKLGQVDILVNNAGITKDGLFMRMKDEDWDSVINVNLTSAFILSRTLIKGMFKRRYGRIINISSVVGTSGNPGQANYCASKGGLVAMTKSIAQEAASRNITANCIAPGFIETAMTDKLNDQQKEAILKNIPTGAMGTAQDIAAAALFLAAEESKYITGQTIHVNGGMLMV